MNNFDAKHIRLSAKYLQESLDALESKAKKVYIIEKKKESKLNRFINTIFKS